MRTAVRTELTSADRLVSAALDFVMHHENAMDIRNAFPKCTEIEDGDPAVGLAGRGPCDPEDQNPCDACFVRFSALARYRSALRARQNAKDRMIRAARRVRTFGNANPGRHLMPTLTPVELQSWIEKRTAEPAAESNLHLWDWQAMIDLKARLAETEARRQESFAFYEDARRQIETLQKECARLSAASVESEKDLSQSSRLSIAWMEPSKSAEAERDQWREAHDEQIRLNLIDKAELVRLREALVDIRKQLADAQTYL